MRWVTIQELSKIAKKSQGADKTIPERTIRHMALQKRIITKKEGRNYLIDPASALRAGLYIDPQALESLKIKQNRAETESPQLNESKLKNTTSDERVKKYKSLGELGVYNELRILYLAKKGETPEVVREALKQTLYNLALGFYEFHQVNKVEYFKRARKYLVGTIVEDDLVSQERSVWRDQVENSIMPGIVGLIRKQEGGRRGNRGQFKAKG